eukprot:3769235-Amphidinium_carterae.1
MTFSFCPNDSPSTPHPGITHVSLTAITFMIQPLQPKAYQDKTHQGIADEIAAEKNSALSCDCHRTTCGYVQ